MYYSIYSKIISNLHILEYKLHPIILFIIYCIYFYAVSSNRLLSRVYPTLAECIKTGWLWLQVVGFVVDVDVFGRSASKR